MRMRVPLVEGEVPSPLQRILAAADSGSGIAPALDPAAWLFLNADLDVVLYDLPEGEWIGLRCRTDIGPNGAGTAHTELHDERGPLGWATQCLVVRKRA
jgi:hypothetical protein